MTIKEKVINETILKIEGRLIKVRALNNATPILDLIKIREEAQKLLEENKTLDQRTSMEFMAKIEILSQNEQKCIKLAKELQGQKMFDLMDEEIKLELELRDLKNEKYYIEHNKMS